MSRWSPIIRYVWSQIRHRRGRALAVAVAVALGAGLFVTLDGLGAGVRAAAQAPLAAVAADMIVTRPDGDGGPPDQTNRGVRSPFGLAMFSAEDVRRMAAVNGVSAAVGALQLWDFGDRTTVTISGVDAAQTAVGPGRILTRNVKEGRAFEPSERAVAVLDLHYARFYDFAVGDEVDVGDSSFKVVGIVELTDTSQAAAANVYVPIADARRLAGLPEDQVNEVHVQVREASDTDEVVSRIDGAVGQVSAITSDSLVQVFGAVGRISARFSTIAGLVGLIAGLLLGWLALQGLVAERRRDIGLLRAVGWRRRDVIRAFSTEAGLLSVVGALVGVLVGVGVVLLLGLTPAPAQVSTHSSGHSVSGPASKTPGLPTEIRVGSLVIGFLAAGLGGTLAGAAAAGRAAGRPPRRNLTSA